ncbi:DinB family protein [Glutamicibacter protophormiae]|uniref:DinB family protein n=1 Tax=Glutamicibacter protophormiae TaxID=37930 RepID=UPI002A83E79F|nr:DinB family protein [Glutamicibacter protophormiae]WPR65333.1 DinB family protein [Glutamicibacter protophormiae]WPR68830.1 DinB family protein [Glutamicibacter protophormiae]
MDSTPNSTAARLREYLNDARQAVIFKSGQLTEELARQPMTATGTHILGVVHHLAITEYGYFGLCLNRPVDDPYARKMLELDDPQADFIPPADFSAQQVIDLYQRAIEFADAGFDKLELASPAEVPWWVRHRQTTLEHLMVHMIAETSRHAGHLDIVRELLDGQVGLRPEAPNLPDYTARQWQEQRDRLQQAADSKRGTG